MDRPSATSTRTSRSLAVSEPVSLDASGDADEPTLLAEAGDPNDSLLGVDPAAVEAGELPEGPTEPEEMGDSPLDQ